MATSRPWSDLPNELVELIANRIDSFSGYIRFGTVCRSWRSVTVNSHQLQALQPPPWVVVHVDHTKIVCFMEDLQLYPVKMPRGNTRCFGSSFGWLMMTNYSNGNNYLLNPCNHQKIQLPRSQPKADDFLIKAVLTSNPSITSINSSGIGMLAINYYGELSCCILGDDEHWSVNFPTDEDYADIIFYRGFLHGLTISHQIVIFEFGHQQVLSHPYPQMEHVRFHSGCDDEHLYLVESAGELLLLVRSWLLADHPAPEHNVDDDYDPDFTKTVHFGVYMLDSSAPRWVKLTSLGGRGLLVGEACSISVDAGKFSWFGFKPNCIYFTDGNADEYEWREFCLKDEKIRKFSSNLAKVIA